MYWPLSDRGIQLRCLICRAVFRFASSSSRTRSSPVKEKQKKKWNSVDDMHIPLFFKGEWVTRKQQKKNFQICFCILKLKKSHMQIITVGVFGVRLERHLYINSNFVFPPSLTHRLLLFFLSLWRHNADALIRYSTGRKKRDTLSFFFYSSSVPTPFFS